MDTHHTGHGRQKQENHHPEGRRMHMHWYGFSPNSIAQIRDRLGKKKVNLCRADRGADGHGAIKKTPLGLPKSLPC